MHVCLLQQQKTATIDAAGALIQTDAWTPLSMWTYQKDVQPDPTDAARFSMPVADTRSLTLFLGTWDGLVLQFDLLTGVLSPEVWYGAGQAAGVSIGTDRCANFHVHDTVHLLVRSVFG